MAERHATVLYDSGSHGHLRRQLRGVLSLGGTRPLQQRRRGVCFGEPHPGCHRSDGWYVWRPLVSFRANRAGWRLTASRTERDGTVLEDVVCCRATAIQDSGPAPYQGGKRGKSSAAECDDLEPCRIPPLGACCKLGVNEPRAWVLLLGPLKGAVRQPWRPSRVLPCRCQRRVPVPKPD
jgi:hypothetical protein